VKEGSTKGCKRKREGAIEEVQTYARGCKHEPEFQTRLRVSQREQGWKCEKETGDVKQGEKMWLREVKTRLRGRKCEPIGPNAKKGVLCGR